MRHRWFLFVLLAALALALLSGCGAPPPQESAAQVKPSHTRVPIASASAEPSPVPTRRATRTLVPPPSRTRVPTASAEPTPVPASPTPRPTETAAPPTPTMAVPSASPVPVREESEGVPSAPVRIVIPALGIRATIRAVGQDATGAMSAPEAVEEVAWFAPGTHPGAMGNAVFSGHLDDYKQDPAVFWRLHELVPGDEVQVTDAAGHLYRFQVIGQEIYTYNQAPLERIFGYTIQRNLNLITCNGTWDTNALNYDKRLVVYTRLIEE